MKTNQVTRKTTVYIKKFGQRKQVKRHSEPRIIFAKKVGKGAKENDCREMKGRGIF